jgi:urease accessory protein
LRVLKALHPEGDAVCQTLILHPPGGVAACDALDIDINVTEGAHAQITTPGAGRWYRSDGGTAHQHVKARIARGGALEWMPTGTIVFEGADARSSLRIDLDDGARAIAWELVCLGRRGANERFTRGRWRQCFEMVRCDALLWSERVDLRGGSRLLDSPAALNGAPVFGTFVAHAPAIDDALVEHARTVVPIAGEASLTRLPDVLVARWRGPASDAGHRYFAALWSALRRRLIGRDAVPPRIWST